MSDESEDKRAKFERLAEKRTQAVLDKLDVLSNCSNPNSYEYSEEDVKRIFKAIRKKRKQVQSEFEKHIDEDDFRL